MGELGLPGVYASTWWALFGPSNLPPEIVAKFNSALNKFLQSEDTRKQMAQIGFQGLGGSSEALTKMMADERVLWSKVIADANLKMTDQK